MGGDKRSQGELYHPQMEHLPYLTEGSQDNHIATSSDDYSQKYFDKRDKERKKQMDDLMNALARLGMVNQTMPSGFVPNPPYRLPEQEFGF